MFIRIVQIFSLATACTGQPLLTFWSCTWMFALIVAALKITYIVLHLNCLYDYKFERECSLSYA